MSKISSKDCKDAILKFAYENKEYCKSLFSYDFLVSPLFDINNWKRICKEKNNNITTRKFDCKPYEDQIRAYVTDNGIEILSIIIKDELRDKICLIQ